MGEGRGASLRGLVVTLPVPVPFRWRPAVTSRLNREPNHEIAKSKSIAEKNCHRAAEDNQNAFKHAQYGFVQEHSHPPKVILASVR